MMYLCGPFPLQSRRGPSSGDTLPLQNTLGGPCHANLCMTCPQDLQIISPEVVRCRICEGLELGRVESRDKQLETGKPFSWSGQPRGQSL